MAAGAAIKGVGGKKGRSGRKSKAEELGLTALLNQAFPKADRIAVLENLARIAKQSSDLKAAVSASTLLLGYAFGKPTEKHEHGGIGGGPLKIQVEFVDETPIEPESA